MPQEKLPPPIVEIRAQVSRMLDKYDPETPIAATVVFQVNKTKESTFIRNADVLTASTRKLPGCNVFAYHKHKAIQREQANEAVQYLIYEDWKSCRFFRVQWDSEHIKHFQATISDLVVAPPDLNFYFGWDDVSAGGEARTIKTGQRRCWDSGGSLIDCAGSGQDGEIRAGVSPPKPRFVDNQDGTVTDKLSGLIWLKHANRFGEVTWDQALKNASALGSGSRGLTDDSVAGDWRLPNVNELQSLLHLDNDSGPALQEGHPFTNLHPANYW